MINHLNGKLKVLTFGAGAIGTYIGGSLALAGHKVVFLERPAKVDELRRRGLILDLTLDERRKTLAPGAHRPGWSVPGSAGAKDAFRIDSSLFVIVSSLEEALRYGPFDVAFFALKSFDTQAALES